MRMVRWTIGAAMLVAGRVMADERTYSYSDLDGGHHLDLGGVLLVLAGLWLLKKALGSVFDAFSVLDTQLQNFLMVPAGYLVLGTIGYQMGLYFAKVLDSHALHEWVVVLTTIGIFAGVVHTWLAWRDYQDRSQGR